MADIITRAQWGARPARTATAVRGARGVKVHYTGSRENPAMLNAHPLCVERVRAIQDAHMDGRRWHDIAYSMIVCVHGFVFEGRGPLILNAANGAGLNADHYSVLGLVGNAGLVEPSEAMYRGICRAIDHLRDHGNAGYEVLGHRDGYPTDCPGDPLYAWVETHPCGIDDDHEGGTDMERVSLLLGKPVPLPADKWTTVTWSKEVSDGGHQHADEGGPSVLNGPAAYVVTASLAIGGLPLGAEYQVRGIEVDADGKDPAENGPIQDYAASSGKSHTVYTITGKVSEGDRLRVQVKPLGHAAVAEAGSLQLMFFR